MPAAAAAVSQSTRHGLVPACASNHVLARVFRVDVDTIVAWRECIVANTSETNRWGKGNVYDQTVAIVVVVVARSNVMM